MIHMFDKYNTNITYIPNNEYEFLPVKSQYKDIMVLNAYNNYSFKIPHKVEDIVDLAIFYMQGTEHKVQKNMNDVVLTNIEKSDGSTPTKCIATYELTPEETLLFNDYNREVKVQLKVILANSDNPIEYSGIYLVKILNSLDKDLKEEGEI